MPSTNIPVKSHTNAAGDQLGAGVTVDPTNGNNFLNDGNTFLMVFGVTATKTLTVKTSGTVNGLGIDDNAPRSIAVGEYHILGPFPTSIYGTTVELVHEAASAHKVWPFNVGGAR